MNFLLAGTDDAIIVPVSCFTSLLFFKIEMYFSILLLFFFFLKFHAFVPILYTNTDCAMMVFQARGYMLL